MAAFPSVETLGYFQPSLTGRREDRQRDEEKIGSATKTKEAARMTWPRGTASDADRTIETCPGNVAAGLVFVPEARSENVAAGLVFVPEARSGNVAANLIFVPEARSGDVAAGLVFVPEGPNENSPAIHCWEHGWRRGKCRRHG